MIFSYKIFKSSLISNMKKCDIQLDDYGFNHIAIYKRKGIRYFKEYSSKAYYLSALKLLTSFNRTTRENIAKLNHDYIKITRVPYYQKNYEVIKTVVSISSSAIGFIPEALLTLSLVIYLVGESFMVVKYLPEGFITPMVLNSIHPDCKYRINFVHGDIPENTQMWSIYLPDRLRPDDWPFPSKSYKELQEDQYD